MNIMARERMNSQAIEKAAQEKWDALKLYETDLKNPADPYYLLFEFPYPSGDLHIGHWYAYAVTDIYARYLRMKGKNVLFPIGFDAFGLPAENAAMKRGADPKVWTYENMEHMRSQIRSIGTSVDWSKEVVTCDPEYYRWTQWLIARLYEKGLLYRAAASVKWCPKDQTVLANEQVIDGKCERCDTEVIEKKLTQWFMRITQYADRLLEGLDELPWREDIKEAQRTWIGKSEGAKLWFPLVQREEKIEVFTTRPDTVYGATYVVLAPEHPLVAALLASVTNASDVRAYQEQTSKKTERERSENKEKTGVELKGIKAINPATKGEIPVFVADYVLGSYGTGAVMAVPAHDERDYEFAKKVGLPITAVVVPEGTLDPSLRMDSKNDEEFALRHIEKHGAYTGDGILINSPQFNARKNQEAMWEIVDAVGGERTTNFRIRDWLVSRQRYWGCPIPIVYDPEGNAHLIPDEHLPWLLPSDVDFTPGGAGGKAPLASSKELHERVERIFGKGWTPEYDTLDTFIDSSWYYLRYLSPHNTEAFSDASLMDAWLPVKRYSGGSEHTTMHLLYARFFHKALNELGLVPYEEPFTERFNRGIILGSDGQKMSKRWGNVINPDEMVEKYGADAVRMYLAFIGPYNEAGHYPWKHEGVKAMRKFLERVYALHDRTEEGDATETERKALAKAEQKVAADSERFKFNTALSALMILVKELEAQEKVSLTTYGSLIGLLAPFAPHLTEHLYERMGEKGSIHATSWPAFDPSLLRVEEASVVVQINGKRRGEVLLSPEASEDEALEKAREIPAIADLFSGGDMPRVIYVPGRILNLVIPRNSE